MSFEIHVVDHLEHAARVGGWGTRRETAIGAGRRADLLLDRGPHHLLIEAKSTLGGPQALRRGLHQIDRYRQLAPHTHALLVAWRIGPAARRAIGWQPLPPGVYVCDLVSAIELLHRQRLHLRGLTLDRTLDTRALLHGVQREVAS